MSLASFGRELLAEVRRIAEATVRRDGTHLRWATITDTDPLRIRYDGETNESIVPPQNTAAALNVGDRVRVGKQDGQATILGPHGGHRGITDGTGTFQIGVPEGETPRIWADLDYFREYSTTLSPTPGGSALSLITGQGTVGKLIGTIGWDYMPFRLAGGQVVFTPTANTPTSTTVTFPSGFFTSAPTMAWTTADTTVPGTVQEVSANAVTQTSMRIYMLRTSGTATRVHWGAAQIL